MWPRPALFAYVVLFLCIMYAQTNAIWEIKSEYLFAYKANITIIPTVIQQDNITIQDFYDGNVWEAFEDYCPPGACDFMGFLQGFCVFFLSGVGLLAALAGLAYGTIRHRARFMPLKFDGFLALAKWGMFASFLPIVVNAPLNVYTDQSIDFKGTWGYLTDELRIDLSARTEQGGHWLLGSVLALQAAGFMLNMAARQPHHHQEAHPPPPGTWSLGGRCAVQWEAACRVRAITNNRYKKLMWKLLGYLSYFVRFIGLGVLVMNLIGLYVGMCEVPSLHVIISASFKHLVEAKDGLALIKKRLRFYFDSEKLLSPKVMIRYLMRTGNDNFYPDNWIIGALALCIVIAVPLARALTIIFLWTVPMHHDGHAFVRRCARQLGLFVAHDVFGLVLVLTGPRITKMFAAGVPEEVRKGMDARFDVMWGGFILVSSSIISEVLFSTVAMRLHHREMDSDWVKWRPQFEEALLKDPTFYQGSSHEPDGARKAIEHEHAHDKHAAAKASALHEAEKAAEAELRAAIE